MNAVNRSMSDCSGSSGASQCDVANGMYVVLSVYCVVAIIVNILLLSMVT